EAAQARGAPLLHRRDRSERKPQRAGLHAADRALERAREQQDHQHPRSGRREDRTDGSEQPKLNVAHPDALSTTITSNGGLPGGWTSNVSAQRPTITTAGADFSPAPGEAPFSPSDSAVISISSMSKRVTTVAPRTGLPLRVTRTVNVSGIPARLGEIRNEISYPFFFTVSATSPGPTRALA